MTRENQLETMLFHMQYGRLLHIRPGVTFQGSFVEAQNPKEFRSFEVVVPVDCSGAYPILTSHPWADGTGGSPTRWGLAWSG